MLVIILLQVFCLSTTPSQGLQNFSSERKYKSPLHLEFYSGSGEIEKESTFYYKKPTTFNFPTTFSITNAYEAATNKNRSKLKCFVKFLFKITKLN